MAKLKKQPKKSDSQSSETIGSVRDINDDYLRYLTLKGVAERYQGSDPTVVSARIEHELATITTAGFPSYFLIVADILRFCRESGIPTGPGRGSVCGSAVAYATRITDVDPLRFGIPFERFLHLERISQPDIDLDICQARRHEVIEYIHEKYGTESVAQIITFGTMAAKGVVRDVCRVLHVDEILHGKKNNETGDRLASLIPEGSGPDQVYLEDFLGSKAGAEFKSQIEGLKIEHEGQIIEVLDTCRRLEGIRRHSSVHAAGVVIADRPLIDIVPLYRKNQQSDIQIQFDMWDAEAIGLLKLDVLGLRTVTVIGDAEAMVRARVPDFSIKDVPLDDKPTFDALTRGDTVGIFQLEGDGITAAVEGVRPDRFEDIIAILALYRPGPMEQLPNYIDRKHGREQVTYPIPDLAPVLDRTYGLIVYQEQVMGIARTLAGFTAGEADSFRKAIGKKLPELIREQVAIFVSRAVERGYNDKHVAAIAEQIAYFGRYGFNLGHATGYGFITYWTAYLKANFPTEFYAATLNSYIGEADKIGVLLRDAASNGVVVSAPDINLSGRGFTVTGPSEIRFGLGAVKGIGDNMILDIIEERDSEFKNRHVSKRVERTKDDGTPYKTNIKVTERVPHQPRKFASAYDFCQRLTHIPINVKKNLVVAGAFGVDLGERQKLLEAIPDLNTAAKSGKRFDLASFKPIGTASAVELMRAEREVMGFYVTGHPLAHFKRDLEQYGAVLDGTFESLRGTTTIAGIVLSVREHTASNGQMAWVTLETGISGLPDVTIFAGDWDSVRSLVVKDEIVIVRAKKTHHPKFGWGLQHIWTKKLDRARPDAKVVQIAIPETDISDLYQLKAWANAHAAANTSVQIVIEEDGRVGLLKTELKVGLSGAALLALPEGWQATIDPDSADSITYNGEAIQRARGLFRGTGKARIALHDLAGNIAAARNILGAKVIAEMERI